MVERATRAVDADVDLHIAGDRDELRAGRASVLAAISGGGVLGACCRYAVASAWPHAVTGFPWSTLVVNVSGCLLIGALMVIVTEVAPGRRLLRPFLGVGVLGGYTTFSTYVLDVHRAAAAGVPWIALAYLLVSVVGAVVAVWAGSAATARLVRGRVRL